MGRFYGTRHHRQRTSKFDFSSAPKPKHPWKGTSKWLTALAAVGSTALLLGFSGFLDSEVSANTPITGRASVTDGDTLRIDGQRIRLAGIDAPESNQRCEYEDGAQWRCGHHATLALSRKVAGQTVACQGERVDQFRRVLGTCEVDGENLNAWMVRQGWAVAYTRYSYRYLWDELVARFPERGIWSSDFTKPENWRRQHKR
jgi:endonuclease YncB( thermonuclease family)